MFRYHSGEKNVLNRYRLHIRRAVQHLTHRGGRQQIRASINVGRIRLVWVDILRYVPKSQGLIGTQQKK